MEIQNILTDEEVIIKRYKVRTVGNKSASLETTIPREVFEREARRHRMTIKEALEKLKAVWRYDNFQGLYLSFEKNQTKVNEFSHNNSQFLKT